MEKEQIVSTLKEKVGQTSFSDRSFMTYVENNLPAEGVEPDDAYWTKHVNVIKSFQGQFSADVSAAITAQLDAKVAKYYQENPDKLKEYIKQHPELLATPPQGQEDEKYKTLETELNKLKEEQKQRIAAENLAKTRLNALAKMQKDVDSKKVSINQKLWEHAVNSSVNKENGTDDDFYAIAKSQYESLYKMANGETATPYSASPASPFSAPQNSKSVSDFFAKKKAREGWGKK